MTVCSSPGPRRQAPNNRQIKGANIKNTSQRLSSAQLGSQVTGQLHVTKRPLLAAFASFPSEYRFVFCDWLSIYQVHPGPLPVINDGFVVSFSPDALGKAQHLDTDTGELTIRPSFDATKAHYTTSKSVKHEGSFETRLNISCDGYKVKIDGNISRFCRSDNVFGLSVLECIAKASEIVAHFGLPPFSELADQVQMARTDTYANPAGNAVITRVDLTGNFGTGGKKEAFKYIHSVAGQATRVGGKGNNAPNAYGNGVTWNYGSRRWNLKLYYKADDLGEFVSDEVKDYCIDQGVVRFEVGLKATELAERGLNRIMGWIGKEGMDMENVIFGEFSEILQRNSVSTLNLADIPGKAGLIAQSYMTGGNPLLTMPSRTARRWRKELLEFGIDLAVPCNVTRLAARVETITLTPLEAPDWYKRKYA